MSNTLKFHLITEELHPNVLPNVLLYSQNISYWIKADELSLSLVVYITGLILYLAKYHWGAVRSVWVVSHQDWHWLSAKDRTSLFLTQLWQKKSKTAKCVHVYRGTADWLCPDYPTEAAASVADVPVGRQDMNIDSWSFTKRKLWQFSIFLCLRLKVQLHFTIFRFKMERSGTALYLLWQMSRDLTWQHITIPHEHKRAHTRTSVCC